MRLATFHDRRGDLRTGAVVGEHVVDLTQTVSSLPVPVSIAQRGLAPDGMMRLLHSGADSLAVIRRFVEHAAGDDALRQQPQLRETRLKPGDRVRIDISRIGTLEHSIG